MGSPRATVVSGAPVSGVTVTPGRAKPRGRPTSMHSVAIYRTIVGRSGLDLQVGVTGRNGSSSFRRILSRRNPTPNPNANPNSNTRRLRFGELKFGEMEGYLSLPQEWISNSSCEGRYMQLRGEISVIMSPLRRHIFVCFYGKMGVFRP